MPSRGGDKQCWYIQRVLSLTDIYAHPGLDSQKPRIIEATNNCGQNVLHIAAQSGARDVFQLVSTQLPHLLDQKDGSGRKPYELWPEPVASNTKGFGTDLSPSAKGVRAASAVGSVSDNDGPDALANGRQPESQIRILGRGL